MKDKKYQKWDMHHHILPDFYVKEMKQSGMKDISSIKWPEWTPQTSLKMMDAFQIEKAFMSTIPGVFIRDVQFSKELCRRCNEYLAKLWTDYPGRFGGFASATLPHVESAIEEVIYALDELKLDGVSLMSNVCGKYLGDSSYREFYAELDKRKAIIYIHPNGKTRLADHRFLNPLYLWQNDTTQTMIDFIKSGYHRDYPNIRWILSHGGGILSPLYKTMLETLRLENPNIEAELEAWKHQVFLETASKAYDEQLPHLLNFTDEKHVLFGSDLCIVNKMAVKTVVDAYSTLDEKLRFSEQQIEDIFMGNAKRLFSSDQVPAEPKGFPPIVVNSPKPSPGKGKTKYHYHCLPQKVADYVCGVAPSVSTSGLELWNRETALKWMAENGYDRIMLSLYFPQLWQLGEYEITLALRMYNDEVAKICGSDPKHFGAFGAIDVNQPLFAINEINHCVDTLELEGICLTTDLLRKPFGTLLDEQLMERIAALSGPVLLHPEDSTGVPLINGNYLDSLYFMAKSFYLGMFDKYFQNTKFVLTHTGDALEYLANPFNLLYYMTVKKAKMGQYVWDNMIRHQPKGYHYLLEAIVD